MLFTGDLLLLSFARYAILLGLTGKFESTQNKVSNGIVFKVQCLDHSTVLLAATM